MKKFEYKSKYNEPDIQLEKDSEVKPIFGKRSGKLIGYEKPNNINSNTKGIKNEFVDYLENEPNYLLYQRQNVSSGSSSSSSEEEESEVEESSIEGVIEDDDEEDDDEGKDNKSQITKSVVKKESDKTGDNQFFLPSQSIDVDDLKKRFSQLDKKRYDEMMYELKNDQNSQIPVEFLMEDKLLDKKNEVKPLEEISQNSMPNLENTQKKLKIYQRKSKNIGSSQTSQKEIDAKLSPKKQEKTKELSKISEELNIKNEKSLDVKKENLMESVDNVKIIDNSSKIIKNDENKYSQKKERKNENELDVYTKINQETKNIMNKDSDIKVIKRKKRKLKDKKKDKKLKKLGNPILDDDSLLANEMVDQITKGGYKGSIEGETKSDKRNDIIKEKQDLRKDIENIENVKSDQKSINLPKRENSLKINQNEKEHSKDEKKMNNHLKENLYDKKSKGNDHENADIQKKSKGENDVSKKKNLKIQEFKDYDPTPNYCEDIHDEELKNKNNNKEENTFNDSFVSDLKNLKLKEENKDTKKLEIMTKRKYNKRKDSSIIQDSNSDRDLPQSKKNKKTDVNIREKLTESQYLKTIYKQMQDQKVNYIPIKENDQQYFGQNNRYPKRNRFPVLNELMGERLVYSFKLDNNSTLVPEVIGVYSNNNKFRKDFESTHFIIQNKKKKVLVKRKDMIDKMGEKQENDDKAKTKEKEIKIDDEKGEKDDINKIVLPNKFYKLDNESTELKTILIIPKQSQKPLAKNYNITLECEVIDTDGNNIFITGSTERENLNSGDNFLIRPQQSFSFQNLSNKKEMKVSLKMIK